MSDITFEVSETILVGEIAKEYKVRRVFTGSYWNEMSMGCDYDIDKLHNFINTEMEHQLKRIINEENT